MPGISMAYVQSRSQRAGGIDSRADVAAHNVCLAAGGLIRYQSGPARRIATLRIEATAIDIHQQQRHLRGIDLELAGGVAEEAFRRVETKVARRQGKSG